MSTCLEARGLGACEFPLSSGGYIEKMCQVGYYNGGEVGQCHPPPGISRAEQGIGHRKQRSDDISAVASPQLNLTNIY